MHATVVVFPGSNADAEMIRTLRDVVQVRTSTAWHRDAELPAGTDLVAIPGGFSYGDYLRCGAIARTSRNCITIASDEICCAAAGIDSGTS